MTEDILRWVKKEKLIAEGDIVIAGVSGGADSVCLLHLLLQVQEKIKFLLRVVHVEHGIRGEESCQDAVFVEGLCKKWKIPCAVYHRNVPVYAKEQGTGLEEAARELRYQCYMQEAEKICGEIHPKGTAVKVALAHHADDNAETMLFQLIRGSGIRGLCGMRPKRQLADGVELIRPLLQVARPEIEAYLAKLGQEYRTDTTNTDVDYSRNRLRHRVMPQLELINSRAPLHMAQSAAMLQEISDYLDWQVQQAMPDVVCRETEGCLIKKEAFLAYPRVLQKEMILLVLGHVAGSRKDLSAVHVEAVLELFSLQVGRSLTLPYGICAVRVYGGVRLGKGARRKEKEAAAFSLSEMDFARMERGETVSVLLPDGMMQCRILVFSGNMTEIPKKKYTKWFAYDKMERSLQIRKRQGGDYLFIDGKGHRKKLKEYFIAEKIPKEQRDALWLLADGAHIVWVVGGRISASCKIDGGTEKILEVQMTGGRAYEDERDSCLSYGRTGKHTGERAWGTD